VQGVRNLRAFLSQEGAGVERSGQGGGGKAAGLRLLQALRVEVPGFGDRGADGAGLTWAAN